MSSLRLTVSTAVLTVAAALTPAAAQAAEGSGVQVTPSAPAPGGDLALRVTGCAGRTGTAASDAFVADARLTGADGTLGGETRIRSTARTGRYDVEVTCGDKSLKGVLTVGSGGSAGAARPSAPASPTAPVRAGGGGTAHIATVDASGTGPGAAQAVTGLLLALGAAVVVVRRSARRTRGAD
ncbi:hypothetical protein ACWC10_37525 [Streptomyces sp. NPDC001595]|uniref:hypothetical protein n=1 Tax=Streptomyces sp. NPDC001532 TaxID=3154520 RepID=UPI00331BC080